MDDTRLAASRPLERTAPELERLLTGPAPTLPRDDGVAIRRESVQVAMRDGIRLATDIYLPSGGGSAPVLALRTPYGKGQRADTLYALARRGYVAVAQDCRGTGDSEPDRWDFMVYELEDSVDFVEWMTGQRWYDGFIGSLGGSYGGWTQWCMARHPAMSAIAPEVAGFGVALPRRQPAYFMFVNAYSRSVGNGAEKRAVGHQETEREMEQETLSSGYFNAPLYAPLSADLLKRYRDLTSLSPREARRQLWEYYRHLPAAERAELIKLGLGVDRVTYQDLGPWSGLFPRDLGDSYLFPRDHDAELFQTLRAPALVITGWYDWSLDYTLSTWERLVREAPEAVRSGSRLLIAPSAHNRPGYHEGREEHPELDRLYRSAENQDLLDRWYQSILRDNLTEWPTVIYYLMGANRWLTASSWPPPECQPRRLFLGPGGTLATEAPARAHAPDHYRYDPDDPTPTLGGSIVSSVYTPGSVDVSQAQTRPDVLTYTTGPLERDLDVVGPMRFVLYASTSAVDTDFVARLSDVFPDGRAIQLQSGTLRARFRGPSGEPELLEPGRIYRLDIDMWATANRFRAGHRLRIDISSADFPRFDRNANRGGSDEPPVIAEQTVYLDSDHASYFQFMVRTGEIG